MYTTKHKHTDTMTRVFQAVDKGQNEKALRIIKDAGIPEAEQELEKIIGFVRSMKERK